jgi:hypothetical protein
VFDVLTKYLLQFRRVSIPHVGTFKIIQNSAELNFVDRLLNPPTFETHLTNDEELTDHQINYLAAATDIDKEKVVDELQSLGKDLQASISNGSFTWNGIGVITGRGNRLPFQNSLTPVTAEKVIRAHADHARLIGDHQVNTSATIEETQEIHKGKKSVVMLVGWAVLILSIAFIFYLLYKNGFSIYSSGLKTAP